MPWISRGLENENFMTLGVREEEVVKSLGTDLLWFFVNGGISLALVLLGGFFAGLTLALMGQDEIILRVLSLSGDEPKKSDAKKVLNLLHKGKHWVLVTLLLGNVIVNETLPVFLDQEAIRGWVAVVVSTGLIVIFGEIIPQSVCAKWGLSIGAKSATLVVWLMYILSPIGYPISKLLDYMLGTYNVHTFSRQGLKTLMMLHEVPRTPFHDPERLHAEEASAVCNFLSLSTTPVLGAMTPLRNVFTLSSDTPLDDRTRNRIFSCGQDLIPVTGKEKEDFVVGLLNIRSLIGISSLEQTPIVGDLELEQISTVESKTHLANVVTVLRERNADMVVVTEDGHAGDRALGIITFRDVMSGVIGCERI